jgi:sodium/hydrogen antiporter
LDAYEVGLTALGVAALVAAWVPTYLHRRPLSLPVVLLALGAAVFVLPLGLDSPDPTQHVELVERVTELGVLVSLMGVGLRIDRPFGWRTWGTTWRLLLVAMPITIALTALLGGAVAGLPLASAVLLGAVLAPTDPVLASDVQVGEPTLDAPDDPVAENEVRFALTSEGGLNDALAFPFVYGAIAIANAGADPSGWFGRWLLWDVVGRVVIGLAAGWAIGRLLGRIAFRPPGPLSALAESRFGFVAAAATLLAYGTTQLLGGYGFLAVFVAAVTLRSSERQHEFQGELHRFIDETEHLLLAGMLLLFGGALVGGALRGLTWSSALCAVLVVVAVRPVSGLISLRGAALSRTERWTIAFFGIRGFGSVYYLAYATGAATFADTPVLWATVCLTLVLSIATHGITATPAMRRVDRAGRRGLRRRVRHDPQPPEAARAYSVVDDDLDHGHGQAEEKHREAEHERGPAALTREPSHHVSDDPELH